MNDSIITLKLGEFVSLFESDHSPVIAFINGSAQHIDDVITIEAAGDCVILKRDPERVSMLDREWSRTLYMCCEKGTTEIPYNPIQPGWVVDRRVDIVGILESMRMPAELIEGESNYSGKQPQ